jgi:hypothetical protein
MKLNTSFATKISYRFFDRRNGVAEKLLFRLRSNRLRQSGHGLTSAVEEASDAEISASRQFARA